MNKFLTKLKLLKKSTIELPVEKYDFISILKSHVDEKDLRYFSAMGDIFSSSKAEYKGHIHSNGFELKKKYKFFDYNINFPIAKGHFRQQGELLQVNLEINALENHMVYLYIVIIIFYLIFIFAILQASTIGFPSYFVFQGLFILGFQYLSMRKSIGRMKRELERDLHLMLKE